MSKLQREKGKRGELEVKNIFASHGFEDAHRSQQFSGKGESSADVVGVDGLHLEVKLGYSYKTIYDFREQAERDCSDCDIPVVCCRMDRHKWLAVLDLDDFIEIWRSNERQRLLNKLP